jgi:hypothetical protein
MTRRVVRPEELAARRRLREGLEEIARDHPGLTTPGAQARLGRWLEGDIDAMTPPREAEEKLTENLGIRVSAEDLALLDEIAALAPFATRHAIARAAMRVGLDEIKREPTRLLVLPRPAKSAPKKGGPKTKK